MAFNTSTLLVSCNCFAFQGATLERGEFVVQCSVPASQCTSTGAQAQRKHPAAIPNMLLASQTLEGMSRLEGNNLQLEVERDGLNK